MNLEEKETKLDEAHQALPQGRIKIIIKLIEVLIGDAHEIYRQIKLLSEEDKL